MKKNTQQNKKMWLGTRAMVLVGITAFTTISAAAAILVQNFMVFNSAVKNAPIVKVQGADANYDGDGNDSTGYLQVKLGTTISNNDATLGTPGTINTLLSNEQISFSCFKGDRTYYTDVIQLQNTTVGENWVVDLNLEADLNSQASVADTFTAGDADIWLFTSSVNSALVTERPNPSNYGSLAQWHDTGALAPIQLEVAAGTLQIASGATTGITIPAGESRTLALVVDCGSNMVVGETGTFRVTVNAKPQ